MGLNAADWIAIAIVLVAAVGGFRRGLVLSAFSLVGLAAGAYIVIAGMIEYAFVYDHTRGAVLVVMTLMLVVFMLAPPLLVGFTVARFQRTS